MDRFCEQLATHRKSILNGHIIQVSAGSMEGLDDSIKGMKRSTHGFTDVAFFMFRI